LKTNLPFLMRLRILRFFANTLPLGGSERKKQIAKSAKSFAKNPQGSRGTGRITRLALFAQLLAVAVIVFHPWSAGRLKGKLRVDFLDVGQGDSALVTFPDDTTLLVDGGGRPGPFKTRTPGEETVSDEQFDSEARSIGESVVSEYLWWRGLDHIDYVLATHADADHIDGLNDIARNFAVRAALVARTPNQDPEY